ncbi:hemerythrin family protein [Candidatus Sulfurimonas marisnigri]|uniref:Hemerythrin family protein n=1 Tax=Candidatus Sulfurimonas marisnigri TaxID=2740405 RepID=A0A7S7LY97_9BACT|nr:hemerythrin family protein [Candidatus Sulfurimonas marisnigri]QOY53602.1 hemerythrin family protein [Candidatus Sulfurimonas marisnigri]
MLIQEQDIQQVANEVINMLHEEEIQVINDFYDAVVAKDIDKIDELFKVVMFDIEDHFKTEEDMMEQNNYSHFQVHKSDHDTMREKLKKFHKRWEILKGPTELQGFLEKDFKKWLILHISKWDTETALHLANSN